MLVNTTVADKKMQYFTVASKVEYTIINQYITYCVLRYYGCVSETQYLFVNQSSKGFRNNNKGEKMGTELVATLFVIGIILLILEVVVPGGILGLFGIIALITAIILTVDSLAQGFLYVSLLLLTQAGLFFLSFRMPQTRFIREIIPLKTCQTQKDGYVVPKQSFAIFLNKQGTSLSQLRPAGTADFGGERLDVVTEGMFIPSGSTIKVIDVEGTRIIVRQV